MRQSHPPRHYNNILVTLPSHPIKILLTSNLKSQPSFKFYIVKNLLASLLCLLTIGLHAQRVSFSDSTGGSIPDNAPAVSFPIVVNDPRLNSLSGSFGFESITLSITHTYDADLDAQLQAPDGTIVSLFANVGGSGNSFTNTMLIDTAPRSINSGTAPFTGRYKADGNFWQFNNHHSGNGVWHIIIRDGGAQDTGSLRYTTITFSTAAALPPPPITSNLPIVKIYTDSGAGIVDDPKHGAWMNIVDNGTGLRNSQGDTVYAFRGRIGIELRGSTSQSFPKKPYGFETWDSAGVPINRSFLGFPSQSDWILNAHYTDKTLFRNNLSYDLARKMGQYASRVRFVELFVNDEYEGVYVAMEKIKRDPSRVNVSKMKLSDTAGSQLTGGYILKIDKFTGSGGAGWSSGVPVTYSGGATFPYVQYVYPSPDSIRPQQAAYIRSYVDSFERSLNGPLYQDTGRGFRHYAAENTFIDYEIINELAKNVDGYRLSTYFYKEKSTKGGLLKMGPVWDYDISYHNADYCGGDIDTGWAFNYNSVCTPAAVPFWWERLMTDSAYQRRLYCRYHTLRTQGPLRLDSLLAYVDSTAALLSEAEQRNFNRWRILGVYVWPNPQPIATTYAGEIQHLKDWLTSRLLWLDTRINLYATQPPVVHIRDTSVCPGQLVTLDAGPSAYTYQWSTRDYTQTATVQQAGNYTVSVTNYYGCGAVAAVGVHVQPLPDGHFVHTVVDTNNYTFTPAVGGLSSYLWQYGDSSTPNRAPVGLHHYDSTGTYTITLTVRDSVGCESVSTDTIHVTAPRNSTGITALGTAAMRIYPNPASTTIYVESSAAGRLEIYSTLGEKLMTQAINPGRMAIDISALPAGIYIVNLHGGQSSQVVKLLKE